MRILIIGCTHFGKTLAGYDWKREFDRALGDVISRSLQADLLVHLGDLFDCGHPTPRDYAHALDALDSIGCPMFIMKGNHDENPGLEPDALEPLTRFRFRQEVKFIREPGVNGIGGKVFAFLPFWNDAKARAFRGKSAQEEADDLIQNVTRMETYNSANERLPVSMLFTHVDVEGLGHPVEETSQRTNVAVKLEDLKKLPFNVAVGHYHSSMHFEPNVYVPGSLLPFDFSEVGNEKFCLTVDL